MALIKCKECGQIISDKATVCLKCGAPVEKTIVCKECGQIIASTAEICPNCGYPINDKTSIVRKKIFDYAKISDGAKAKYIMIVTVIAIIVIGIGVTISSIGDTDDITKIEHLINDKEFASLQSLCDEKYSQVDQLTPKEKIVLSYAYYCLAEKEPDFGDMYKSFIMIGFSAKDNDYPVLAQNIKKHLTLIGYAYEEAPADLEGYYSSTRPTIWPLIESVLKLNTTRNRLERHKLDIGTGLY